MIQLLYGAPGSGKTYYAVNYLLKFTEFDELYDEFILKTDLLIISNIEGLKIKHWKFPECMGDKSLTEFLTIENFEQIQKKTGKTHIIMVLDEAHDFFPSGMVNKDLYSFFAYHRHIGLDVILLTQGLTSIARFFNPLFEFFIEAEPRGKKIINVFKYKFKTVKGETLYIKPLKTDKNVFRAYKSQRVDESSKPFNPLKIWVAVICLVFVGAFTLFQSAISGIKSRGTDLSSVNLDSAQVSTAGVNLPTSQPIEHKPVSLPAEVRLRQQLEAQAEQLRIAKQQEYILLPVQGFIKNSTKSAVMVNGEIVYIDGINVKNYDPVMRTVEYKPVSGKVKALRAETEQTTTGAVLPEWATRASR